ncbi:MAG: hypothetical protein GY711_17545 [bacterium]|nr:hypothetical protein [bacterium]
MSIALVVALVPLAAQDLPIGKPPTPVDEAPHRGLTLSTEHATPGYTLISPLLSDRILLIDSKGEVAHEWKTEHAPGGGLYFLENGHVMRVARKDDNPRFHGGGIGGLVQEFDWDGNLVWEFELANDRRTMHHDIEPLPNGNVLAIAWEHHTSEEAIARGRDPEATGDEGLWADVVMEIRPTRPRGGEIVWEWSSWDHLIQDRDAEKPGYSSIPDHPERIDINGDHRDQPAMTREELEELARIEAEMRALGYSGGDEDEEEDAKPKERREADPDWLHTNSVAYHPELDLIVLSTPEMNELWVIDHGTTTSEAAGRSGGARGQGGDLLYRWGNPRNYGRGKNKDKQLWYQHDPTWLPGSPPRILVFNNGMRRPEEMSVVLELTLPFDAERGFQREPDAAFGPVAASWSYSSPEDFFGPFISGAQRLANGNTLICEGPKGRVFEVTRDGRVVWDFRNPHGGDRPPTDQSGKPPKHSLFRAKRIGEEHPGLAGRL